MRLSQNDTVLNHLANGGTLSRLEALFSFRIQNITARVCDLRDRGINISTRIKRDPQGAEYAEYYLTPDALADALRNGFALKTSGIVKVA
jgi:hypothetical protein